MSTPRPGTLGSTRVCPHCKTTILESAAVCPACKHHLRFDEAAVQGKRVTVSPFRVEGTIQPPAADAAWEYSMVLSIKNERGEEIARQVVGVGALHPEERRTFTLAVEVVEVPGYRAKRKH